MKNKKQISFVMSLLSLILLITIGLSYAYFSANLTGTEEETTITVTGGTMNILYNGGSNINAANIIPQAEPIAIKNFTVTGNNTTNIIMRYKISLEIVSNTFTTDAIKYKLISENTNNNGILVPSVHTLTNIGTGSKSIELGVGEFASPTSGNKVHTYKLEIYFPNQDYNQNEDQGKELSAYIKIENAPQGPRLPTLASLAKVGDYIDYKTLNFQETDAVPASTTYSVFNGKVAGRSTSIGIDCANGLNPTGFDGWVVLSNIDGVVKLMSSGTPECYKNSWNGAIDLNNLITRNYSEYVDETYALSATVLDKTLAETVPGASIEYNGYIDQYTTPILRAGARYFFATINPENTGHLFYTQPTGYIGSAGGQNYGIRIVVTLKQNIYLSSGLGTSSDPYIITEKVISENLLNQNGVLTGYWLNWNSTSNIKLRHIPLTYNIVSLSFGTQNEGDSKGKISFSLDPHLQTNLNYTEEEFKSDINIIKNKGQKVVLSIGGANTQIIVDDEASKNEFVQSLKNIIDTYNLNGIDVNIENTVYPTYLSSAIIELANYYGQDFTVILTPQTVDIQSDRNGNISGNYYELIKLIQDKITIVNMQLYNTGTQYGVDGILHTPGTVDFIVAYADIMKKAGLRDYQIGLGMIANSTKVGYVEPNITTDAIKSLRTGGQVIGGNYIINVAYPRIGGIMIFSLNEDVLNNYKFSNEYRKELK